MRKVVAAAFAVCIAAIGAAAQEKPSYAGTWKLDVQNSTFAGPMRVESMTLTVVQTEKEIKVDTATKRLPPNNAPGAVAPGVAAGRAMGGGRGGFGFGDGSTTYPLDGREATTQVDGPNGKMPVVHKGKVETDGSLKLTGSRTFNSPMGEMTMTTSESWKLSADGKTLTINRENSTPRGNQTSRLVFVKG